MLVAEEWNKDRTTPLISINTKPGLDVKSTSLTVQLAERVLRIYTQEELNLRSVMVRIDTIDDLFKLKESEFGRPRPRHGLNLLYWFAHDYVNVNSNNRMVPLAHPKTGLYGFHMFHNFPQAKGERPLPSHNLPYFEVGNLNAPGANRLPQYVMQDFTHQRDDSNKDRIIVRMRGDVLEKVYITEHIDKTDFGRTHEISQDLLATIKNMKRKEFLQKMEPPRNNNPLRPKNGCCCTIL
ncbi:hypothetical protein NFI96_017017 [Prochilodus magdalenae]|nr:hypothetical protein NFI96_017017 [Prochilodus magdalenae]